VALTSSAKTWASIRLVAGFADDRLYPHSDREHLCWDSCSHLSDSITKVYGRALRDFIFLLMLANLRGVESGRLFMIPTYTFIVSIFILIGLGLYQQAVGQIPQSYPDIPVGESLSLFLY